MITEEQLDVVLSELLPCNDIRQFPKHWILSIPNATEESVRTVYRFLREHGVKDSKIVTDAHLLGYDPENVDRNYQRLSALGIKDAKIATNAQLLGNDPDSIEKNYQRLSALGIKDAKIVTNAQLLGRDPEIIERNYQRLSALGIKDAKIATNAHLLGNDPETIERNYRHHVGLLRRDCEDRSSGKDLLINHANLLGIPPETIESNIQYMHSLGIDYNNNFLLGTTTQLKRKKMAWLLRELFDYRDLAQEQKKDAVEGLYDFVRDNTHVLWKSIKYMEKNREKLRRKAEPYRT